jgi:hypothetical protein
MTRRERLYGEFIEEASRLFTDALTNQFDDPSKFVRLYALVGKLRLCTSSNVITKAEEVMQHIVKIYHLTNRDFSNPEERQRDDVDVLRAFSEACREDLGVLDSGRRGCRRRRKRLCEPLDQETHPFRLILSGRIDNLQPRAASGEFLQKLDKCAGLQVRFHIPKRFPRYAVSIPAPVPNQAAVVCDPMPPDHDPPRFAIDQKGPISVDRLAEMYKDAFVVGEIVSVPRISFISQICRRGTHRTPLR